MERMLVTEGLNELKTLDARIRRAIDSAKFVDAAKGSNKNVDPSCTKDEFNKNAIAALDSINALIKRREAIKSAIIESNAKTLVEVCGKQYTVAKLIDMKTSIQYHELLLSALSAQYSCAKRVAEQHNLEMNDKIDQLVMTAFGKDSKSGVKDSDYEAIAKPYKESNEYVLVDPISAREKMEELQAFIEEFKATVDSKLQISNCTTFIEF